MFHLFRGDLDIARELSEECLVVVAPFPESPFRSWAHLAAGMSLFWLGRLVEADRELQQSFALYDVEEQGPVVMKYGQDCGATSLGYLAVLSCALGRPDRGSAQANEAVALAQRLSHAHTTAVAMSMAAATHQLRREPGPTRERAEAAIALSTEHILPMWHSMGHGPARVGPERGGRRRRRHRGDARRDHRVALAGIGVGGAVVPHPARRGAGPAWPGRRRAGDDRRGAVADRAHARSLVRAGVPSRARPAAGPAETAPGGRGGAAPRRRAAREREATGFELRAAVALGRFLAEDERSHEARRLVGDIVARRSEGLDTPDVAAARALLARLG